MPRRAGEKASATVARQTETMSVFRSIPPPAILCFISFPSSCNFFFSFFKSPSSPLVGQPHFFYPQVVVSSVSTETFELVS